MIAQRTNQGALEGLGRSLPRLIFMAAVTAFVVSVAEAAEQATATPPGKKLYEARCIRCHKDLDPTIYDDMTWKRWLWKMKDKARLDNEEYGDLSDYLKGVREAAKSKKTR
ncbi:MAG: cytochrome c [Verrucomicrobia bacterium]|nr:cytochrome c [Verrucomicrobiota bacterium]